MLCKNLLVLLAFLAAGPLFAQPTAISILLRTGNDDLRGGNDNINISILYASGNEQTIRNANKGQRLADRTNRTFQYNLSRRNDPVRGISVAFLAAGGFGGDNWNIDKVVVNLLENGRPRQVYYKTGSPVVRLTGNLRKKDFTWKNTGPVSAPAKMTTFNEVRHGFKFANRFRNDIAGIEVNGLCGGMVYAALDYFYASGVSIPRTTTQPAGGSRMHGYIKGRQLKTFATQGDKWAELIGTNFGNRDQEVFNWGLQMGSGRLGELTAMIDAGRPAPLGLQTMGPGNPFSHQVLAIGYKLGRFRGNLGSYKTDVEIYVYDPNYPNERMTLVPDPSRRCYKYKERPHRAWRTYFVDKKYRAEQPPR